MLELNYLLGYKNRKIYQSKEYFSFTLDSVLLAEFVKLKSTATKILDIGSGTGAIPLILSLKTEAIIDAVEIQEDLFYLLKKSVSYNQLNKQINIYNEDIKNSQLLDRNNYYDNIVCNPPYFKETKNNQKEARSIARHEISLNLEDVAKVSKKLLKNNGKLSIVYDAKRLVEALQLLEKNNLIPKRIQFIHTSLKKEASIFLLECVKNGRKNLKIEPPFVLYQEDGKKTKQYEQLLNSKEVPNESKKL